VFESGAILLYLAEKTGKFIGADLRGRVEVLQWLFWQMGGLGPMAGQNHHFGTYAPEKLPYAIKRYVDETNRLYGVLNKRLADRAFVDRAMAGSHRRLAYFFLSETRNADARVEAGRSISMNPAQFAGYFYYLLSFLPKNMMSMLKDAKRRLK
jgi:hypothetical protein